MFVSKIKTLLQLLRQLARIPIIESEVWKLRQGVSRVETQTEQMVRQVEAIERAAALAGLGRRIEELVLRVENLTSDASALAKRELQRDMRLDLDVAVLKRLYMRANVAPPGYYLSTDHPVASTSDDHKFPRGTVNDDTRWPRFCKKAEMIFQGRKIRFLDIGCAGGGLVFDFLIRGHDAAGIEGSDLNRMLERAHWGVIPDHLFTCDAAEPYRFLSVDGDHPIKFDLISCWEVLEHIPAASLAQFFRNVKEHLAQDGLFVASVATFEDRDAETGAVWHKTVRPKEWWLEVLARLGLEPRETSFIHEDFARGTGNPFATDWDARRNPELGFHIVAAHAARSVSAVPNA